MPRPAASRIFGVKKPDVWGLVLAGGRSRRMGQDKALLETAGETQLSRTVSLLQRHLPQVFVSARQDQAGEPERSQYPQVIDSYTDLGPMAGILSALDTNADVAWLVVACDLPNITDTTISQLLEQRDPNRPFSAYRSSRDNLPEPLCAIYEPTSRSIVVDTVEAGIRCPRKMLIRAGIPLLELSDPAALHNVNTPDDLRENQRHG